MKNHLKRIATPKTWSLKRKAETFVVRPHPGGHKLEFSMAIGMILRDKLGLVQSLKEAQKMLHANKILVDNKHKKDRRDMVGLFDIISILGINKYYQVRLSSQGKLEVVEIDEKLATKKIAKVVGKTKVTGNKNQLRLYDGKTILSDVEVKVGDSVEIDLVDMKIKSVLPRKKGAKIFLVKGKHAGSTGILKSCEGDDSCYQTQEDKKVIETATKYLFVVA
jgi:small subunit ribosomal protein S4e